MTYYEKLDQQGYYIIAEIGVNYYEIAARDKISLLDSAKLMIKNAADNGADAVKFQAYAADRFVSEAAAPEMYHAVKAHEKMNEADYSALSLYAKELNVDFFVTAFDDFFIEHLSPLMPLLKIASADITCIPLIEKVARKNKPVLLSVGGATRDEIDAAISIISLHNEHCITLLYCVLQYPTPYEDACLSKIKTLREFYPNTITGYSDHTIAEDDMMTVKAAYLLGAKVIEKHFTLDKSIAGNDHGHSMNGKDLRKLKNGLEHLRTIKGDAALKPVENEKALLRLARRSAVAAVDIKRGQVLDMSMISWKRPGTGLDYKSVQALCGLKSKCDIKKDAVIRRNFF